MSVEGNKTEKIYNICKKLGANTYIAGLGSKRYMQSADFREIDVKYFYPCIPNYESSIVYTMKPNLVIPEFEKIKKDPLMYCMNE